MERKESIINVARRHFSRYGYSKTTMEEIARDCGITKPTLYNHFASKADLFHAVIDNEQQAFYKIVASATANLQSASDRLRAYAEIQIKTLEKFLNLGELTRQAFLDLHPDVIKIYSVYREKEEAFIANWIQEGVISQEFAPLDVQHAARVYYLCIAAIKYDQLIIQNQLSQEDPNDSKSLQMVTQEIHKFINIFLNGLVRRD